MLVFSQPDKEVGSLVNKGVLVTDLKAGNPPVLHVRMIAVCDVNASPAAERTLIAVVEVFEPVEIMEVPAQRGELAVDLKCVECFVPPRIASGFEGCNRTVTESRKECACIVDTDGLFFPCQIVFASLDKGLGH